MLLIFLFIYLFSPMGMHMRACNPTLMTCLHSHFWHWLGGSRLPLTIEVLPKLSDPLHRSPIIAGLKTPSASPIESKSSRSLMLGSLMLGSLDLGIDPCSLQSSTSWRDLQDWRLHFRMSTFPKFRVRRRTRNQLVDLSTEELDLLWK